MSALGNAPVVRGKRSEMTDEVRLQIFELLLAQPVDSRPDRVVFGQIGENVGFHRTDVEAVATAHGWPSRARVEWSRDLLVHSVTPEAAPADPEEAQPVTITIVTNAEPAPEPAPEPVLSRVADLVSAGRSSTNKATQKLADRLESVASLLAGELRAEREEAMREIAERNLARQSARDRIADLEEQLAAARTASAALGTWEG